MQLRFSDIVHSSLFQKPVKNLISKEDRYIIILSSALFIILFLNLFSPFGIKNSSGSLFFMLVISFYGIMAGAILYAFEFGLKKHISLLQGKTIKLYRLLGWYLLITVVIAIVNYGYYTFLGTGFLKGRFQFPPKSLLFFLGTTFSTALVMGLGLFLYFRSGHKKREVVHIKNLVASKNVDGQVQFWSGTGTDSFTVDLDTLLFLEKRDNYVVIYYLKDAAVQKKLLRASLKTIEEKYIRLPLLRCHVSFIVNLAKVKDYKGNSKGLRLFLNGYNEIVPVSSRYYQVLIDELAKLSYAAAAR